MILNILLLVGLLGSLLMFGGDMLLYFTMGDYKTDGTFKPVINIMRKLPDWRLKLGGILGPIAAFFYCIGFFHIVMITDKEYFKIAIITFLIYCLGIIIGGAYHSQCSYLGLLSKDNQNADMGKVINNISLLSIVSFVFMGIALFLLVVIMILGKTQYPRWIFVFSPGILYFLKNLWKFIPQPFRIIMYGGWYNLMFSIYYLILLLCL